MTPAREKNQEASLDIQEVEDGVKGGRGGLGFRALRNRFLGFRV